MIKSPDILQVLMLEDNPLDVEVIQRMLIKGGLKCKFQVTSNREDYETALQNGIEPDIILSDYNLPMYNGWEALRIARIEWPETPFIFISGSIGEERAIELLKSGATDYILKDNLSRLVPAVNRAIEEAVSRRMRKEGEIEVRKLGTAVEQSRDWILITNSQGIIEYVNKTVVQLSGYTKEELIGRKTNIFKSGQHEHQFYVTLWGIINHGLPFRTIFINRRKNMELFTLDITITPLADEEGRISQFIATGKDITQETELEKKIHHLVLYSALTGLPNRNMFNDELKRLTLTARETGKMIAVLSIDLDRFKYINDTYGPATGDQVLKETAKRITSVIGDLNLAAHMGSDEFAVILMGLNSENDVYPVIDSIFKVMENPIVISGSEMVETVSIGISIFPKDGLQADILMNCADSALGEAKKSGRNIYKYFAPDMNMKAMETVTLQRELSEASRNNEFLLHYQPYFSTTTKKIVGMEALMRWNRRAGGMVSPGRFIPVLEETGLIVEAGQWALEKACQQIAQWKHDRIPILPISVNLSPFQFRTKNLIEIIKSILNKTGVAPHELNLEITESIFMEETWETNSSLQQLSDMGFHLSIDDFGTGYSSFGRLKKMPIDYLKIDQSFIKDMVEDKNTASIINALITLAHTLDMKTIAEGVENEDQYNLLSLLHCDMIQGYYFSKPLSEDKITDFILTHC